MELVAVRGLVLTAFTAEPATASADNLALLATWAATEARQRGEVSTHRTVHGPND